jgi:DNA-binding transcriptional LysR family regulator
MCCSTKMKSETWNWSDLRVFLAVLDAGSTLAASKALGMAQPTVARRIDALEHATGLTLFERDTRGAQATLAARELEAEARAVAGAVERFEEQGRAHERVDAGQADQADRAQVEFLGEPGQGALADFTDMYPSVRFELIAVGRVCRPHGR